MISLEEDDKMAIDIQSMIKKIDEKYFKTNLPDFDVGDTVKMIVKEQEADKVRLHPFEGIIIRKGGKGVKATFTVRKISFGEGVERIFPLHSPVIDSLQVISKGVIKRAKLYYLRQRTGKGARLKKEMAQEQDT